MADHTEDHGEDHSADDVDVDVKLSPEGSSGPDPEVVAVHEALSRYSFGIGLSWELARIAVDAQRAFHASRPLPVYANPGKDLLWYQAELDAAKQEIDDLRSRVRRAVRLGLGADATEILTEGRAWPS